MSRYPKEPGWKGKATSRAAAAAVKASAPRQADLARAVIVEMGRASPEEITATLNGRGHKVLLNSIRARCTQMHKLGDLKPSGQFARGESGRCKTIRWEVAPKPPATGQGAAQ